MDQETIAAIATASGAGAIGIVRLSGPEALSIGTAITRLQLTPRHAYFCTFHDDTGTPLDSGISIFFPGPHSFTGEDIVELQAHGSPVILDLLLRECCKLGARQATPGEFSLRAYLNGKIDLAQAEAIADLINSTTEQAALNATRSLRGAFSETIDSLIELITRLRIYVEAAIDFPEEEIDFIADGQVALRLLEIREAFNAIKEKARQGSVTREGLKLVIAGRPNAGKSTLLNALAGQDTAIVTPIAGTTRDVLREHISIDGLPLHIVDTAGLRNSGDAVEREGIRRAWEEMESSDHILLVVDGSGSEADRFDPSTIWLERGQHLNRDVPMTIIFNKCDLASTRKPGIYREDGLTRINLSAKTGAGMEFLKQHLKESAGFRDTTEGSFSARRRHLLALNRAEQYLAEAEQQLAQGSGELLAEDLRQCHDVLGEITGGMSSDELLGEIFSSFCIGK